MAHTSEKPSVYDSYRHCKQGQPRVDIGFGPALAHNGRNVLKIAERVLLVKMLDIRNVFFQIPIISVCFST